VIQVSVHRPFRSKARFKRFKEQFPGVCTKGGPALW